VIVENQLVTLCSGLVDVDLEFSGGVSESGVGDVVLDVSVDDGQGVA
jgi:hypothetical protein